MKPSRRAKGSTDETTTTVTLPVPLLEAAKILAVKRHTTLKVVMVAALSEYLARQKETP